MTVSATTPSVTYTGNGVTTALAVPFPFFAATDLVVSIYDSSTQADVAGVTLNGATGYGYTVTGAADPTGTGEFTSGTVTFVTAPTATQTVSIARVLAATQPSSFPTAGPFQAKAVEAALDRLTMLMQQAAALITGSTPSGAALNLPPSYTKTTLPVGAAGMIVQVSDAVAGLGWGDIYAGGGGTNMVVRFNGTNWTVMG